MDSSSYDSKHYTESDYSVIKKHYSNRSNIDISVPVKPSLIKYVLKFKIDILFQTGYTVTGTTEDAVLMSGPSNATKKVLDMVTALTRGDGGIIEHRLDFPQKIQKKFWNKRRIRVNGVLREYPGVEVELLENENQILVQGRDPEDLEAVIKVLGPILDQLIAPPQPREKASRPPPNSDKSAGSLVKLELKYVDCRFCRDSKGGACKNSWCWDCRFTRFTDAIQGQGSHKSEESVYIQRLMEKFSIKLSIVSNKVTIRGKYAEPAGFELVREYYTWFAANQQPETMFFQINNALLYHFSNWKSLYDKHGIYVKVLGPSDKFGPYTDIQCQFNTENQRKYEEFKSGFVTELEVEFEKKEKAKLEENAKLRERNQNIKMKGKPNPNSKAGKALARANAKSIQVEEPKENIQMTSPKRLPGPQHSLKRKPHLHKNFTSPDFHMQMK